MNDQARSEMLERLRTRPRGSDLPHLSASFPFRPEPLSEGVISFLHLAGRLAGTNRYVEEWRQVRTEKEHNQNSGLDIIQNPDEFIDYLRTLGDTDALFAFDTLGFSAAIQRSAANYYTAGLSYSGGLEHSENNTLGFFGYNEDSTPPHTLTLQEWVRVVGTIVDWRTPLYVSVGSPNYGIYDRVFEHRAWDGWMGWFPARIAPASLPGFALTFDIGPGTLVATQETNVITTDATQLERAKEVEIALAELDILPTVDFLIGR